ncbi:MAG: transcriptional repressor [Clostridiales bacterium]|jgi:Fur family ferric uptake transcriptional regulator|nr:transcriptional repressor [Clostridiales bacterium]
MVKGAYATKQKELIHNCLREHAGGHITADMIHAHLLGSGARVGLTTVYRHLEKLVNEGSVIKYSGPGSAGASYQYLGNPDEHREHYHLVCLNCGRMEHLSCELIDEFCAHIKREHHFLLDSLKTVFYGYCDACRAEHPSCEK